MRQLNEISCRMLARTAAQPRVLVALIQCATMAIAVIEVSTENKEDIVILTIVFSTERELFTRQEGHNSRRNIYSVFQNQHRFIQSNQSPNARRTGSVTEFFKAREESTLIQIHDSHTWHLVSSKYSI